MSSSRAVPGLPRGSAKAIEMRLFPSSCVRNKVRRQSLYKAERLQRNKDRRTRREKRRKEREELGDKAPPKDVPKTIENCRVPDETIVLPDDEETLQDEKTDEFSAYFDRRVTPKVLITSADKPSLKTHLFMRELCKCIPNSEIRLRRSTDIKKIVVQAVEREYTDILVVNEDRKLPNGLLIVHLPEGPTAHFKVTSFKRGYDIRGHGRATSHQPEVVLNNFSTRLGHTVGRMFAALFSHNPQFRGRQVVTFHNQRDFIFFRFHRYIFRNAKKVGMQELGPRFTLKLRSLQKGTFDSKYGDYIWTHNRKQMDTTRRRFHL